MRIGFLMDPLEGVRVEHDSTFALMLECQRRGFEIRELRQEWMVFADGAARSRMRTVAVGRGPGAHFRVLGDADARLSDLDVLFLRKDPPVDVEFRRATQLGEVGAGRLWCNHRPRPRTANGKLCGRCGGRSRGRRSAGGW